jgi:molybdopterin/thiamine biosynthesis adenylyltransferase
MSANVDNRFDRQMRLFGEAGQARIAAASVAVIGAGGLGSPVVLQLSLLGVKKLAVIDAQEVKRSSANRYVGLRHDDPIPGTLKVDLCERVAHAIDPAIEVEKVADSLVSERAFRAIIAASHVISCVDNDGVRLVSTELCAAYAKPYFDLASDIMPGENPQYGGRVCVSWDGNGCPVCLGVLDLKEANALLAGPDVRKDEERIYGVDRKFLGEAGPSVVSINGVIASIGVTELMAGVTGIRLPFRLINYYAHLGRMTISRDEPKPDCYYCKTIRGMREAAEVERYIAAGVGRWLR